MTQSTTASPSRDRAILFQCDDELAEFAALFAELAMPVEEFTNGLPAARELEGARLAVVSGRRLLESRTPNLSEWPRTIAVVDDASKTLVTHLRRIGVSMVIRRPIHPRALRLLLLHEIYRGPERRVRKRVLIGHAVRIASGLFRPRALLLELSTTGARLGMASTPKIGSKIRILLGKELTNARPIKLQARVVRCIRPSNKKNRTDAEIGVVLLDAQRHAKTIKGILDRFALGPAKWKKAATAPNGPPESLAQPSGRTAPQRHTGAPPLEVAASDERAEEMRSPETTSSLPPVANLDAEQHEIDSDPLPNRDGESLDDESIAEMDDAFEDDLEDPEDRRRDPRISYDERVVALDEEAARVLVGRDLSAGGMRIAATPCVAVGHTLRVALHSGCHMEPLVVLANALRDDGDDGIVLAFDDLSDTQNRQLSEIIANGLPVEAPSDRCDDLDDGESTTVEPIIVAEMLETVHPRSDAEIAAHLDSVFDTSKPVEDVR